MAVLSLMLFLTDNTSLTSVRYTVYSHNKMRYITYHKLLTKHKKKIVYISLTNN